jgi:hypothetical protein
MGLAQAAVMVAVEAGMIKIKPLLTAPLPSHLLADEGGQQRRIRLVLLDARMLASSRPRKVVAPSSPSLRLVSRKLWRPGAWPCATRQVFSPFAASGTKG